MFGLFVEYIKYFSNAINEIVQMIKAKDQLARTDLIQKNEKIQLFRLIVTKCLTGISIVTKYRSSVSAICE